MITVSTTAGLLAALKSAAAGAVIALMPGNYTPVITNFNGSVTIQSGSSITPAKITSLTVWNSSGITFRNLEFDASNYPVGSWGPGSTVAFQINQSSRMVFANLNVHGSPTGTLATDVNGLLIRDGSQVIVTNSDFHNLHNGLEHLNMNGFIVSANHFHRLRDWGVAGGGSNYVTVQNNACDSIHPDGALDPGHPDCIIFWTTNTTATTHDIWVTGNTNVLGSGTPIQGIFFADLSGKLPFNRVTIRNNTIKDAAWDGIYVNGATNVTVSGNKVCQTQSQASWVDMFTVKGLTMSTNSAPMYNYAHVDGLVESGNILNEGKC